MLVLALPETKSEKRRRINEREQAGTNPASNLPPRVAPRPEPRVTSQILTVSLVVALLFAAVGGQLALLAVRAGNMMTVAVSAIETPATFARPDIVDRNGRLLATDVEVNSLYADPSKLLDRDEALEKLATILPDLDEADLRKALWDRNRHFAWIRRGLTPRVAQAIHNLGIPGLGFRHELRRVYPLGAMAGHILGRVDIDNKGLAGIERYVDEKVGIDAVHATRPSLRAPVRLSIEIGAQAGLEAELADAMDRYRTAAAAAVLMDVRTGEVIAAASLPRVEPARAADSLDPAKRDRLQSGTYELGSIFKMLTIAQALDAGSATPDTIIDVRQPLVSGRFEIKDLHAAGRALSVTEIFLLSSNVGAGLLALQAGASAQQAFLERVGLLSPSSTQVGPLAIPVGPASWGRTETITVSYGHGIAVAPLQFAAAAGALVNGGLRLAPTFLAKRPDDPPNEPVRVVSAATSDAMRALMRANVTDPRGTGHRADVAGYDVGGKTGTADIAGPRGYKQGGVISSFLAAFPMGEPHYVLLTALFEPQPSAETSGKVLAGLTAAPVTGRIIARIGPLLE